jgi:hypothetical protein
MGSATSRRTSCVLAIGFLVGSMALSRSVDASASVGATPAGSTVELAVGGRAGVPSDAIAAVLNITVTNPTGAGYVTVWPCGEPQPTASNLNYTANETIPNLVISKLGASGKVCIYSRQTTDLIADVAGFFPAGSGYQPISNPTRILDTRNAGLSSRLVANDVWDWRSSYNGRFIVYGVAPPLPPGGYPKSFDVSIFDVETGAISPLGPMISVPDISDDGRYVLVSVVANNSIGGYERRDRATGSVLSIPFSTYDEIVGTRYGVSFRKPYPTSYVASDVFDVTDLATGITTTKAVPRDLFVNSTEPIPCGVRMRFDSEMRKVVVERPDCNFSFVDLTTGAVETVAVPKDAERINRVVDIAASRVLTLKIDPKDRTPSVYLSSTAGTLTRPIPPALKRSYPTANLGPNGAFTVVEVFQDGYYVAADGRAFAFPRGSTVRFAGSSTNFVVDHRSDTFETSSGGPLQLYTPTD